MEYNIFTVANDAYFPFLDIFINSINKNSPKVKNIFVLDTGLGIFSEYIQSLPKVKIIKNIIPEKFSGVHSSGWYKTTESKTTSLLNLFSSEEYSNNFIPTILLDNDVYIHKELGNLIDTDYDIQVTTMEKSNQHVRADGIKLSEIACFVCFNNLKKSQLVLHQWITTINEFKKYNVPKPHETPALNVVLVNQKHLYKIKYMREKIVCPDMEFFDESYAIHFKSNGTNNVDKITNFMSRVKGFKNYSTYLDPFVFLNKEQFEEWKN